MRSTAAGCASQAPEAVESPLVREERTRFLGIHKFKMTQSREGKLGQGAAYIFMLETVTKLREIDPCRWLRRHTFKLLLEPTETQTAGPGDAPRPASEPPIRGCQKRSSRSQRHCSASSRLAARRAPSGKCRVVNLSQTRDKSSAYWSA